MLIDYTNLEGRDPGTRLRDVLSVNPERGYLQNLHTGTLFHFLFNPNTLKERYEARYKRHQSAGLSREQLHYLGNPNAKFPIQLVFDQLVFSQRKGINSRAKLKDGNDSEPVNDVDTWRRFLISLLYPRRAQSIKAASPPPVLFYWPNMISMQVRIMRAEIEHIQFEAKTTKPRIMIANVDIEEDAPKRIYSEDLITYGTNRPWASGGPNGSRGGI